MGQLSRLAEQLERLEKQRDAIIEVHSKNDASVHVQFLTSTGNMANDVNPTYETVNVRDFKEAFCYSLVDLINKRIDTIKKDIYDLMFEKPVNPHHADLKPE